MYCHLDRKKLSTKQLEIHTSYNSSCKWTKSLDIDIFDLKIKRRLEFSILKFTDSLLSCCCPVQKYPPRMAKLAWQLSRCLSRGSVNFKINSRPLFTIIVRPKNDNFKTRDFSPLIERVLSGVTCI